MRVDTRFNMRADGLRDIAQRLLVGIETDITPVRRNTEPKLTGTMLVEDSDHRDQRLLEFR
jgi:hypothetical protein